ncbi:MAG: acetyltransferase [Bacteroidetes bacterium]|nr:acetyltransferase [Bacteroidota bacterium]MBS1942575.1 acetyltransferase [Bacteroidota bacterium]
MKRRNMMGAGFWKDAKIDGFPINATVKFAVRLPVPMKCLIVGARADGHAKVVLEVLRADGGHEVVGFIDDDPAKQGQAIKERRVVGTMADVPQLMKEHAISGGIVAIGDNARRRELSASLKGLGLKLINAIHPTVHCDEDVVVGEGCYIGQGAVLVTGTRIGNCVNIHTGATIDHDNTIGDGANLGPGVHTAGRVSIGMDAFLGTGTVVIPDTRIGQGAVCGAGTVVVKDVAAFTKVVGNPARVIENLKEPQ